MDVKGSLRLWVVFMTTKLVAVVPLRKRLQSLSTPRRTRSLLDGLGTFLDLVDLFGSMVGDGEDVSNGELYDELLNNQQLLEQLVGMQGDIFDQLDTLLEGQNVSQTLLEQIAALQQQHADRVDSQLGGISEQIGALQTTMVGWFQELGGSVNELKQGQQEIADSLVAIQQQLKQILARLDALENRVEWDSIIGMISDHLHRVEHFNQTLLDIPIQTLSKSDSSTECVDMEALRAWALGVTDNADGLLFSLSVIDRVLMGDTLLGKPLMEVFCSLITRSEKVDPLDIWRYYKRFAVIQTQGYLSVAKARHVLGQRGGAYTELLQTKLEAQAALTMKVISESAVSGEWIDPVNEKQSASVPVASSSTTMNAMFMAPGGHVVIGMRLAPTIALRVAKLQKDFKLDESSAVWTDQQRQTDEIGLSRNITFGQVVGFEVNTSLPNPGVPDDDLHLLTWVKHRCAPIVLKKMEVIIGFFFRRKEGVFSVCPIVGAYYCHPASNGQLVWGLYPDKYLVDVDASRDALWHNVTVRQTPSESWKETISVCTAETVDPQRLSPMRGVHLLGHDPDNELGFRGRILNYGFEEDYGVPSPMEPPEYLVYTPYEVS
jgi:hypothetical protein